MPNLWPLEQLTFASWMRAPKRRFESQSPLEMMRSEAGSRLVEEMLIQIEEGMFA